MFVRDLKRRVGRFSGPLVAFFLVTYFSYHLLNGERGVFMWRTLEKQVMESSRNLENLAKEHDRLERRVTLLRTHICPSLLEEELRRMGYAHPKEVVVYR
tara:strand:- start:577 stop:876 length:300 start_codon:yes stop_codon:yes gene_type:complete